MGSEPEFLPMVSDHRSQGVYYDPYDITLDFIAKQAYILATAAVSCIKLRQAAVLSIHHLIFLCPYQ